MKNKEEINPQRITPTKRIAKIYLDVIPITFLIGTLLGLVFLWTKFYENLEHKGAQVANAINQTEESFFASIFYIDIAILGIITGAIVAFFIITFIYLFSNSFKRSKTMIEELN